MEAGWHEEDCGTGRVEFVIGMEWSSLWRLPTRPWISRWFVKMVRSDASVGLEGTRLGWRRRGPVVVQRWATRAHLDGWARDARQPHAPSWARFRGTIGATANWGLWHEIRAVGTDAGSPAASAFGAGQASAALAAQTA